MRYYYLPEKGGGGMPFIKMYIMIVLCMLSILILAYIGVKHRTKDTLQMGMVLSIFLGCIGAITATSFMIFTIAEVIYESFGTNEISYYQCVEAIGNVSTILAGIFGVGIYGLFKNGVVNDDKKEG